MPLYETVMQEKPPVVLDIGTAYTKLGFAAEAYPRKIIPSEVILSSNGKTKALLDYDSNTELYDQFVDFLQMIFFKHLLVIPKERKIVIVENVLGQTIIRETLARVLFRHFEVSSIMFVPLHMAALATLAVPTGIVVDMGYTETTVMPVYSRVQILQAFQDQAFGGRAIHAEIKRQLLEAGVNGKHLTESILEDIKVRTCFVTNFERAKAYRKGQPPAAPPDLEYLINGEEIIIIPGTLRETVFEIMFEENNDRDSLPHLILRAILSCPVDVRRALIESIFVVGGSAIIMGLLSRLRAEMQYLAEKDEEYKQKLCGDIKFKFHKTIGRENFTAWLGGSLCGGTDLIQTHSLTKEAYVKTDRVPDWINLSDKRATA
ncbi:PREDICTED: actin-related protein 10 [Bactrocera latifrons]|uniref:Actin-related protein 10 n=1 Tax=Bactrocera latifrons TaxID=174628 RepID=A0A0K8VYV3_BACLA|nr:PREDICTED: actin-related protein 10 [Bactrocera latifrons]